jgi:hypothetical protein
VSCLSSVDWGRCHNQWNCGVNLKRQILIALEIIFYGRAITLPATPLLCQIFYRADRRPKVVQTCNGVVIRPSINGIYFYNYLTGLMNSKFEYQFCVGIVVESLARWIEIDHDSTTIGNEERDEKRPILMFYSLYEKVDCTSKPFRSR